MHASIAVAHAYDRLQSNSSLVRQTIDESHHWTQSVVLFGQKVRGTIKKEDKDPIWATAAALAVLTFVCLPTSAPGMAWPMKNSDTSDWEWLHMSKGKMALWSLTNPLRPDSLFHVLAPTFAHMHSPLPMQGADGIVPELAFVCAIDNDSTIHSNPYFNAVHTLCRLYGLPDEQVSVGQTEPFVQSICGAFEDLLKGRDPTALLLLYLWYQKASRTNWWVRPRAQVECPSICLYLRLYHGDHGSIAFLPGGFWEKCWA
jgi:hypothetical protein